MWEGLQNASVDEIFDKDEVLLHWFSFLLCWVAVVYECHSNMEIKKKSSFKDFYSFFIVKWSKHKHQLVIRKLIMMLSELIQESYIGDQEIFWNVKLRLRILPKQPTLFTWKVKMNDLDFHVCVSLRF